MEAEKDRELCLQKAQVEMGARVGVDCVKVGL
jgi:hypothetical protein